MPFVDRRSVCNVNAKEFTLDTYAQLKPKVASTISNTIDKQRQEIMTFKMTMDHPSRCFVISISQQSLLGL